VLPLSHRPSGETGALASTGQAPVHYRLGVFAVTGIGTWIGSGAGAGLEWRWWELTREINAHGSGRQATARAGGGGIPDEGPDCSGARLHAWAVKNALADGDSYYVRLTDCPSSILFGAFPEGDAADLFTLQLK
jgi:hypothetical protein